MYLYIHIYIFFIRTYLYNFFIFPLRDGLPRQEIMPTLKDRLYIIYARIANFFFIRHSNKSPFNLRHYCRWAIVLVLSLSYKKHYACITHRYTDSVDLLRVNVIKKKKKKSKFRKRRNRPAKIIYIDSAHSIPYNGATTPPKHVLSALNFKPTRCIYARERRNNNNNNIISRGHCNDDRRRL